VKPQGQVMPTGRAMGCAEQTEMGGGRPARVIASTLVTHHRANGGHRRALFADHPALALRAFRDVRQGASLEVTVDGRPRSQPAVVGGSPSPVADRAEYHVMDAVHQAAARLTGRLLASAAPRR
jgi:hypothetical protein